MKNNELNNLANEIQQIVVFMINLKAGGIKGIYTKCQYPHQYTLELLIEKLQNLV